MSKHRTMSLRTNKLGQPEIVRKEKGKRPEGTLSELDRLADDLLWLIESINFGQAPALSAEQPIDQREYNQPSPPQLVASRGDPARANGDSITNMTVAPQTSEMGLGLGPSPADSPDMSRAKVPIAANPLGGRPTSKYNQDTPGDGLDYGATHSEHRVWSIQSIAESIEL